MEISECQDTLADFKVFHQLLVVSDILLSLSFRIPCLFIQHIFEQRIILFLYRLSGIQVIQILEKDLQCHTVSYNMSDIKEQIVRAVCLINARMVKRFILFIHVRHKKVLPGLLKLFICLADDRDINSHIIMTETLICSVVQLDNGFQTWMDIKQVLDSCFQSIQIYAVIQMDQRRQVGCCVAPHHICKINLQVGQRINRPHAVIHFFLALSLNIICFQLLNRSMSHQIIQCKGEIHIIRQFSQEKNTSHGIHAGSVKICINAEVLIAHDAGYNIINLLLKPVFRHDKLLPVLFLLLLLAEIIGPFDLPGRRLLKWILAHPIVQDTLEGRQLLIDLCNTLSHCPLDICDITGLRIFEIRIDLRGNNIIIFKDENILYDRLILKHILNLLRSHIFTIAQYN